MAKKAFIIGANTLGLLYSEHDAELIHECLEKLGYDVVHLTEDMNKSEIIEQFDDFIDGATKTDTCIFYFSGHGYTPKGELLLVLDKDLQSTKSTINIHYITKAFEACRANDKLVILDCCKAGHVADDWNPEQSERYRILTASEKLEKGKELDHLQASFLTYHIHQAFTKHSANIADQDNNIRINKLYEWLVKQAEEHNGSQNTTKVPIPNLLGNSKANFTIAAITPEEPHQSSIIPEKITTIIKTVLQSISPLIQVSSIILSVVLLLYQSVIQNVVQTKLPVFSQAQATILIGSIIILLFSVAIIALYIQFVQKNDAEGKKSLMFIALVAIVLSFNLAVIYLTVRQISHYAQQPVAVPDNQIHPEKQILFEGYQFLRDGELEKAERRFHEAMKQYPQLPDPWYWKANVAMEKDNKPVALQYLQKALERNQRHVYSIVLHIKVLILTGGHFIEQAQKIANASFGISEECDRWLRCLFQHNIFSTIVLTETELDVTCSPPIYDWRENI